MTVLWALVVWTALAMWGAVSLTLLFGWASLLWRTR